MTPEQRQQYNTKRRSQYHRQTTNSRQKRRDRERARYHSVDQDRRAWRNERRAKMERDRYRKLSQEELEERNRLRRDRAAAARRVRAAAGGGSKKAAAASIVHDPSHSVPPHPAPQALAEVMHHPVSELLPHHSHLTDQLSAEGSRLADEMTRPPPRTCIEMEPPATVDASQLHQVAILPQPLLELNVHNVIEAQPQLQSQAVIPKASMQLQVGSQTPHQLAPSTDSYEQQMLPLKGMETAASSVVLGAVNQQEDHVAHV